MLYRWVLTIFIAVWGPEPVGAATSGRYGPVQVLQRHNSRQPAASGAVPKPRIAPASTRQVPLRSKYYRAMWKFKFPLIRPSKKAVAETEGQR